MMKYILKRPVKAFKLDMTKVQSRSGWSRRFAVRGEHVNPETMNEILDREFQIRLDLDYT